MDWVNKIINSKSKVKKSAVEQEYNYLVKKLQIVRSIIQKIRLGSIRTPMLYLTYQSKTN
jgi:hypothetical protein